MQEPDRGEQFSPGSNESGRGQLNSPAPASASEERNWMVGTHLSGLVGMFVGPLVIWLLKKDQSPAIAAVAKEALNFQISCTIYFTAASILTGLLVGFLLLPLIWLGWLGLMVVAAIKASNGESFQYPATIRLIK